MSSLRISEIFHSLQGETRSVGCPTVFVRLTGCPLRCHYCDTAYAFYGGKTISIADILENVSAFNADYVTVTGGEPLAQKNSHELLEKLCNAGYKVSLETSGALDVSLVDKRVVKIVDLKTPGSGEDAKNRYENLTFILPHDQIKFVICNREDYEWSKTTIEKYQLTNSCELLFSPSYGEIDNDVLAGWILEDQLKVRFQLQLHKIIWGDVKGR